MGPAGRERSVLAKNLPPVERGSWDQLGGIQLNRLLVSYPARVRLGWQLTFGKVDVGHSCSSKRQDCGDRKGE